MHVEMERYAHSSFQIVLHEMVLLVEAKIVVLLTLNPYMRDVAMVVFKMHDTCKDSKELEMHSIVVEVSRLMQALMEAVEIALVHVIVVVP